MVLGNWKATCKRMKLDYCLPHIQKLTIWNKDLNIIPETMNYIEKNIGIKLMGLGLREDFVNLTTKQEKANINKWDYIKQKSFCTAKETANKMKKQTIKREKIFANNSSDKALIYNICQELIQLN